MYELTPDHSLPAVEVGDNSGALAGNGIAACILDALCPFYANKNKNGAGRFDCGQEKGFLPDGSKKEGPGAMPISTSSKDVKLRQSVSGILRQIEGVDDQGWSRRERGHRLGRFEVGTLG